MSENATIEAVSGGLQTGKRERLFKFVTGEACQHVSGLALRDAMQRRRMSDQPVKLASARQ
ncbi:hypothetical protein D3C86_1417770 [compost metagenome]